MTDMVVPCEVVSRSARLLTNEEFPTLRLDRGCIISTNGSLLTVERVGNWSDAVNLYPHPDLLVQCDKEAAYSGTVTFTFNPMLSYMTAKTTFGYVHPTNLMGQPGKIDGWLDIVNRCAEPSMTSVGAMYWHCDSVYQIASVSPSGAVVFEEHIDINKPVMLSDKEDDAWRGFFVGYPKNEIPGPAAFPSWLK